MQAKRISAYCVTVNDQKNKMNTSKVMPCGWQKTGIMREHIAHYRSCKHPACRARREAWNKLVIGFRKHREKEGVKDDIRNTVYRNNTTP